jgi:hypothetical protein
VPSPAGRCAGDTKKKKLRTYDSQGERRDTAKEQESVEEGEIEHRKELIIAFERALLRVGFWIVG